MNFRKNTPLKKGETQLRPSFLPISFYPVGGVTRGKE